MSNSNDKQSQIKPCLMSSAENFFDLHNNEVFENEAFEAVLIRDKDDTYVISDGEYNVKCFFENGSHLPSSLNIKDEDTNSQEINITKWNFDVLVTKKDNTFSLALIIYLQSLEIIDSKNDKVYLKTVNINSRKDIQQKVYSFFLKHNFSHEVSSS
jgi:hypothetical protein